MIKETLYTSIGAAALAVDFVTSTKKQQNWLKKAERRGSKLANTSQAQIRPVTKQVESAIEELRVSSLSALGLAERPAPKKAVKAVRRATATTRVSRRRRTTRARVGRTSLTLQTPASQAS